MEIYVQGDGEVTIKYFCPSCSQDPRVNPPMACKKVFGLEDVTVEPDPDGINWVMQGIKKHLVPERGPSPMNQGEPPPVA